MLPPVVLAVINAPVLNDRVTPALRVSVTAALPPMSSAPMVWFAATVALAVIFTMSLAPAVARLVT